MTNESDNLLIQMPLKEELFNRFVKENLTPKFHSNIPTHILIKVLRDNFVKENTTPSPESEIRNTYINESIKSLRKKGLSLNSAESTADAQV